jgi:hypothetical protein
MDITNRLIYRRNVLDINPNKAIGVSLPFNGTAVFNSTYTTKDQLKSNIINLVLTEPGERINEPSFGVGIKRYIFEETIDQGALLDNITYQTQIFIPELEIIDLLIKPVPDENTVQINLIYSIKNQNITENLQININ